MRIRTRPVLYGVTITGLAQALLIGLLHPVPDDHVQAIQKLDSLLLKSLENLPASPADDQRQPTH